METVVAPNTNVIRGGVLIGFVINLGSRLVRVSIGRNPNWSLTILIATTGVVGTPQMVLTNLIMIIHVNMTTNQPPMNSMDVGRYKNVDATNRRGGY